MSTNGVTSLMGYHGDRAAQRSLLLLLPTPPAYSGEDRELITVVVPSAAQPNYFTGKLSNKHLPALTIISVYLSLCVVVPLIKTWWHVYTSHQRRSLLLRFFFNTFFLSAAKVTRRCFKNTML